MKSLNKYFLMVKYDYKFKFEFQKVEVDLKKFEFGM